MEKQMKMLDEIRYNEEYQKLQTFGDWKEFCLRTDTEKCARQISYAPVPWSNINYPIHKDGWMFSKVVEATSFDVDEVAERLIKHFDPEDHYETQNQERDFHEAFNNLCSHKNMDTYHVTEEKFPELWQFMKNFEFETDYQPIVRYAVPNGGGHSVHSDRLLLVWPDGLENEPFNKITKSPEGHYIIRVLVALNDWRCGMAVGFEDQAWMNWKAGDGVAIDWANSKHWVANFSYEPRLMFRVTGTTRDPDHWIFDAINNGTYRQL